MVVLFAVIPWRLLASPAQIIRYEFVHELAQIILASVLRLKIPCKTSSFSRGIGFTFAPTLLSYNGLTQWVFHRHIETCSTGLLRVIQGIIFLLILKL